MKYNEKLPDDSVNVSRGNPVKEFFKMLIGLLVIVFLVYIILGFSVSLIAPLIPHSVENAMGSLFKSSFCKNENVQESEKLQIILDKLKANLNEKDKRFDYKVCFSDSKKVNALALPGGNIVFFKGLYDMLDGEIAVATVLAHELGHFKHFDHLKGLGRSLVSLTLSIFLSGGDSEMTEFVVENLKTVEMKFSRNQEKAADLFAIDLVLKSYGKVDGAADFFEKIDSKNKHGKLGYYFSSHPHPKDRLKYINKKLNEIKKIKEEIEQ